MSIAEFSERMRVGIGDIDAQHVDLFDVLNQIADLAAKGVGPESLDMALSEFRDHVVAHFAWEEGYMARQGIASLDSHRTLHEILVGQLDEMVAELRAARFSFFQEALQRRFLPWLVEHIVNVDKRLAEEKKSE